MSRGASDLVVVCVVIGLCVVGAAKTKAPEGWHSPHSGELPLVEGKHLSVNADFDGDGRPDTASIFVRNDRQKAALFVYLSSQSRWMNFGELDREQWRYEIVLIKPGKYETACGKGYGEYACSRGEPRFLTLRRPAIDLFVAESSDTYIYWDSKARGLKDVLITD